MCTCCDPRRHLYLEPLRECYLFKTCKPKFLDAILAVCRTELFMPNVRRLHGEWEVGGRRGPRVREAMTPSAFTQLLQ